MALSDTLAAADMSRWSDRLAVVREIEASLTDGGDVREALIALAACVAADLEAQDFAL